MNRPIQNPNGDNEHGTVYRGSSSETGKRVPRSWRPRLPNIYFAMLLAGLGVMSGVMYLPSKMPEALNAYHSATWPSAPGVIVSSLPSDDCAGEGCIFFLDITYDFFVDGVKYESHRQEDWCFEWFRDRSAKSYPAGKQIRVYYNPHNPGTSVLEPGLKLKHISDILYSLLFVAGMGLALFGPAVSDETGNA